MQCELGLESLRQGQLCRKPNRYQCFVLGTKRSQLDYGEFIFG